MAPGQPAVLQIHNMADTWRRRLFTTGAVILVLLGLVHSLSLIKPPVPANDTERQLLELMTSYKFNLMGSVRSLADLERGFSISFMLSVLGLGVLDLLLARERPAQLRRLALINTIWLGAMTVNSLRYFFLAPTAFLVAALLLFALAWLNPPADAAGAGSSG
jgi:hypothetical protein